jgi:hypothetical protein
MIKAQTAKIADSDDVALFVKDAFAAISPEEMEAAKLPENYFAPDVISNASNDLVKVLEWYREKSDCLPEPETMKQAIIAASAARRKDENTVKAFVDRISKAHETREKHPHKVRELMQDEKFSAAAESLANGWASYFRAALGERLGTYIHLEMPEVELHTVRAVTTPGRGRKATHSLC